MSHRGIARLLTLLLGLGLSLPAAPETVGEPPPFYQVELVIFARNDLSDAAHEVWPLDPGVPEAGEFRELRPIELETSPAAGTETEGDSPPVGPEATSDPVAPDQTPDPFEAAPPDPLEQAWRKLPAEQHRLTEAVERLERSRHYRLLFHEAWRQPVAERGKALPIRVTAGEETLHDEEEAVEPDPEELLSETWGYAPLTSEAMELEDERETHPPLEGLITISRGRYLHLQADLLYHRWLPVLAEEPGGGMEERRASFRMRQHRRMRSREVHYLDHPVLGVIVLFTPWEAENRTETGGGPGEPSPR